MQAGGKTDHLVGATADPDRRAGWRRLGEGLGLDRRRRGDRRLALRSLGACFAACACVSSSGPGASQIFAYPRPSSQWSARRPADPALQPAGRPLMPAGSAAASPRHRGERDLPPDAWVEWTGVRRTAHRRQGANRAPVRSDHHRCRRPAPAGFGFHHHEAQIREFIDVLIRPRRGLREMVASLPIAPGAVMLTHRSRRWPSPGPSSYR